MFQSVVSRIALLIVASFMLPTVSSVLGQATATPKVVTKAANTETPPATMSSSDDAASPEAPKELIDKLAAAISGTKWTGKFTVHQNDKEPRAESYEIQKAEYQGDNKWLLMARIAYGERDITVPIPVEILWAGRTPVITIDALTIPPLGTFDARVLIRCGSYAGTWTHGKKGGHLYGRYEKMETQTK